MDLDLCDEVMILSPRKVRVLSVVSVAAVASEAVIFLVAGNEERNQS